MTAIQNVAGPHWLTDDPQDDDEGDYRAALRTDLARFRAEAPAEMPACPWWCDLPAGHPFSLLESRWDDDAAVPVLVREHSRRAGAMVSLARVEEYRSGLAALVGEVELTVGFRSHCEDLTAAEARRLAGELLAIAADHDAAAQA